MAYEQLIPVATEVIGGVLSTIQGAEQERESKKLALEAQKNKPPLEDPEERSFLNELQRKRRAIATGTAYQQQLGDLGSFNRATQQGVIRASGGAGGAAIQGITNAQRNVGNAFNQITQAGQQQEMQYTGMANMLNSRLASRRAEMQMNEYQRMLGQSADAKLAGQYNKNAGISSILGGVASGAQTILSNMPEKTRPVTPDVPLAKMLPSNVPQPNLIPDVSSAQPSPNVLSPELIQIGLSKLRASRPDLADKSDEELIPML